MADATGHHVPEEEIMKMRLLFDGDGQGDERRMNMLLKNIIKFANSEEGETACETLYQRMMGQLASVEWNMAKSRAVKHMNKKEEENYENLEKTIGAGIEDAKREIEETKKELEEAKQIRKNRLEYDQLGKVILEHPDRQSSLSRLQSQKEEMESLRAKEKEIEEKLAQRKKQFHLLISTIHQLQTLISEEDGYNFNSEDEDQDQTSEEITILNTSTS